ncbi:RNA polymerase sigma factor [Pelagicoccus albus]|uniref:RNA polymerase sigma factor n=1 Tax=Pelagicoccus albus TaxID=415222 RepID=A0A7X1E909_9BACT|nr:sigma-70 family RNA polymerase sigma factor [Pelagicoccus albus]MBC2607310.1 sigma-70 family RNA polymerase sigma factor [Pelagicoccus albus]
MNTQNDIPGISEASDASLVVASLGGDRQAFGNIVTRYQRMLCSVAYSNLGNLAASEDVAQDTFIEAWKKLGSLKEPEKLKSWLCGILRFKISHRRRKEARQPVSGASELEEAGQFASEERGVDESAMKEEEQALLWQALEKVPENYREPLVLFYREHRSIEHVAYELDLTEATVKQRLSRGRKMLQERMMGFVEDALSRSTPGRVFTASVLASLPALAPPAKAAGVGVVTVKAASWFKWLGLATFLASVSGFISSFVAIRTNLDQSRTPLERRHVVKTSVLFLGIALGMVAALFLLRWAGIKWYEQSGYFAVASQVLVISFALFMPIATVKLLRDSRRLRSDERRRHPELFKDPQDQAGSVEGEYRSKATLFGVPLVHAKLSLASEGDTPAFGWIAAGDYAYGLLFAWGGVAIAPISVGIVSVGLLTCGAMGLGIFAIGTLGVGVLAVGAAAIGIQAYASLSALGWHAAAGGGFSIAREYALGALPFAKHANDEAAHQWISEVAGPSSQMMVFILISFLVLVPVTLYAKVVRRRMGKSRS